ncbi:hypothetical protein LG047_15985 [Methylocystis sp. WRRC1]|uniref:hypothetical protein n=1 Tax=Methylocystis sp. WRRC1 TaxID=1732014 RepID=UPI001D14EBD5|nr:hypothetical protein [Methylocystis sp. WRRC1]MCC3246798.1 hypothetical protein [Methylocystis sp. WRRC1]
MRRTAAKSLQSLGGGVHIVEKRLNHVSGSFRGIVGVYQRHEYLSERRQAFAMLSAQFESLTGANGLALLLRASRAGRRTTIDRERETNERPHEAASNKPPQSTEPRQSALAELEARLKNFPKVAETLEQNRVGQRTRRPSWIIPVMTCALVESPRRGSKPRRPRNGTLSYRLRL